MENQKSLAEILAENKASGKVPQYVEKKHIPTWSELRLDGHIRRLPIFLIIYFLAFIPLWLHFSGGIRPPTGMIIFMFVAPVNYAFMTWTTFTIQRRLHEAGLLAFGGGSVLIGLLLLGPSIFGWCIPMVVLLNALGVRRRQQIDKGRRV